ncbi:FecR domain-containing protein [Brevundimonas sp. SORGH_AS_0993]|uniref:FecR family protein n=1 Tax=Brevundimonas sp. SORGH_AS_0993 TaxID=3041794 RepID=UPI0027895450|nr:FecR domain-containing protein [Brevundimonas sp. SORGH_AS_0993]MDQ1153391.1 transmembrane sensor [Brevundimonas sp. SORGH_AS_0993]
MFPIKASASDEPAEAAAVWFARRNAGGTTDVIEEADFRLWLDSDPTNAAAYRDYARVWRMLGESAAEPDLLALRAAALKQPAARLSRRAVFGLAGGAVAASCAGLWVMGAASPARALISTQAGQRLNAALPDGSEAVLAPSTRLRLDFANGRRAAVLEQGQAYFDLTPNGGTPFVLRAGDYVLAADSGRFQLTLLDGRPDVVVEQGDLTLYRRTGGKLGTRLSSGQKSALTRDGLKAETADVEVETAWRTGRLVVRDRPLSEVVAAFNHYSVEHLVIEDRAAGDTRISGSFRYDGGREFALALASGFNLSVKRTRDGVWRIHTPDGSATVR